MKQHARISCLLVAVLSCASFAFAQPSEPRPGKEDKSSAPAATVACSPARPFFQPGEKVVVTAYVDFPEAKSLQYSWSASAGRISGEKSQAVWDLSGVGIGVHESKLHVSGGGSEGDCSVRVALQSESKLPPRGSRETGRSLLLPNEVEENGYGLYSYLLFG